LGATAVVAHDVGRRRAPAQIYTVEAMDYVEEKRKPVVIRTLN